MQSKRKPLPIIYRKRLSDCRKTSLKKINGVFGVVCLVGFASLQNFRQTTKASLLKAKPQCKSAFVCWFCIVQNLCANAIKHPCLVAGCVSISLTADFQKLRF